MRRRADSSLFYYHDPEKKFQGVDLVYADEQFAAMFILPSKKLRVEVGILLSVSLSLSLPLYLPPSFHGCCLCVGHSGCVLFFSQDVATLLVKEYDGQYAVKDTWQDILTKWGSAPVNLSLPKFSLHCQTTLGPALDAEGLVRDVIHPLGGS